jgi:hypothetical protein
MNDKQIERFLSTLEKRYNNELNLIQQFDMAYFDTEYLEQLYVKWQLEEKSLNQKYYHLIVLALSSPIWLLIGGLGTLIQSYFLAALIYLFPTSILITSIGIAQLYHQYGGLTQYKTIGKTVRQELLQRTHKMYI